MESKTIFRDERKHTKIAVLMLIAMFVGGFSIWFVSYPVVYASIAFWIGAVLMAIPGYAAMESFGSLGLGSNFSKRWSRASRIAFGVLWMLVCLVVFGLALSLLSSMVER